MCASHWRDLGEKLRRQAAPFPERKRRRERISSLTSHCCTLSPLATRQPRLPSGMRKGLLMVASSCTTRSFTGEWPVTALCLPHPVITFSSAGSRFRSTSPRVRSVRRCHRRMVCAVPAERTWWRSSSAPLGSTHLKSPFACATSSQSVARSHCPHSSNVEMIALYVIPSGSHPLAFMSSRIWRARSHLRSNSQIPSSAL
mmetsp:Transcript_20638/g.45206  ORF Transcript_20638/g.45206 Transcript_20638/m.45206 type:complete len:200 (+) Transcript_20638:609-1208(+)